MRVLYESRPFRAASSAATATSRSPRFSSHSTVTIASRMCFGVFGSAAGGAASPTPQQGHRPPVPRTPQS